MLKQVARVLHDGLRAGRHVRGAMRRGDRPPSGADGQRACGGVAARALRIAATPVRHGPRESRDGSFGVATYPETVRFRPAFPSPTRRCTSRSTMG